MLIRQVGWAAPACADEPGRSGRSQRAGPNEGPAPPPLSLRGALAYAPPGGVARGGSERLREGVGPGALLRNEGAGRAVRERRGRGRSVAAAAGLEEDMHM